MSQPAALTMKGMASMSAWFTPPRTSRCNAATLSFHFFMLNRCSGEVYVKCLMGQSKRERSTLLDVPAGHSPGCACWINASAREMHSSPSSSSHVPSKLKIPRQPTSIHLRFTPRPVVSGARNGPSERVQWYSGTANMSMVI